jgi:divalent metal cation (Fe/Co/Zn/Cd) transporter
MKSILLGILLNLGVSVTNISAGMVGYSFALVADGWESGADVLSGLVSLFFSV